MKILSIETSCDETAISIADTSGELGDISFKVLADSLLSQVALHKEYGGVYPSLAKREHAKNLTPLLQKTLSEASMFNTINSPLTRDQIGELKRLLVREPELFVLLIAFLGNVKKPNIDAIAVTVGPGLEPALWVGINFAKALSIVWDIPLILVNHMEGHILSSLIKNDTITAIKFPALALLISGGHTQLVLMSNWSKYEIIGETRDDAVGEAFDKVARMLELSYPGGPEISKLAGIAREENISSQYTLPRPMIDSNDFDFSFSGIKTAVLYKIKEIKKERELSKIDKKQIAREFEDAVAEVLLKKTKRAVEEFNIKTFILGGGVSANKHIRYTLETHLPQDIEIFIPPIELTGDNAIMIAAAGYLNFISKKTLPKQETTIANGNLHL
ncbi:MAG TPA: tRNA (adenosine(37)-N6)-threonylcarbamoyltransferase complex transferase subunit TsaD [Candidatus Kaiserbacteria bacterium]|nr:tRNA (adenosine(37)-N6)-threonylcarbamoyltransferase complex transferase subunit TsaD [Candidatus Kaiserbacteria bacterium]